MSLNDHQIDARDRSLAMVLNDRKYTIDYFQREYSWEKKHIEQLVTDLTSAFLEAYTPGDSRASVEHYNKYYLGPFVVSSKDGCLSIIDGQQRLTSLTLFLIFLNNLQKELKTEEKIESLIFSEKFGSKSFNIQVEERLACLEKLFHEGDYETQEGDDESTENMAARYVDIIEAFPEEIKGTAFPYFIDWLKENVVLVEITAYSDDNAYAIFESMNDRGLNLTSAEMLKGYLLSRFQDTKSREKANQLWKETIQELHAHGKEEDQQFCQAWLRSQYAETIRQSRAGSSNEDFEKIGTRFHSWFRDNLDKVGLHSTDSQGFKNLLEQEFRFYARAYLQITNAQNSPTPGLEHVFYINISGIANSLAMPLMLAPLTSSDSPTLVQEKIDTVAKYIETFVVRRSVNFKKYGASSIRYTMCSLTKEIRRCSLPELKSILQSRLDEMDQQLDGMLKLGMHGQNKWFIKYLLSRISSHLDQLCGVQSHFIDYYAPKNGKPYQIEHIWADKFDEHKDEFDQLHEFETYRNRLGDLVLLPQGTNQSYGDKPYSEKVTHYVKENLLVKSLHPKTYENNPNFVSSVREHHLAFTPHESFNKQDIDTRQALYLGICQQIWTPLTD